MFEWIKNLLRKEQSNPVVASKTYKNSRQKRRAFTYDESLDDIPVGVGAIKRSGKFIPKDIVFDAWTSGNLDFMVSVLDQKTHIIDRHYLLQNIVSLAYKEKKGAILENAAKLHIAEFDEIKPALLLDFKGILPRISTFQYYAMYLTSEKRFDEAIKICEIAINYGVQDNTQSGFEGRIVRINKNRTKIAHN
ncbi:hypothetical protein ACUHGC_05330 [Testudinibacter sp. P27/CKL/0425]